ncbi:MAG TPA: OstA-like protein, partial [Flavisolibacter sp.]|nr:OstA-like protein [Flavisolibacter sp.]
MKQLIAVFSLFLFCIFARAQQPSSGAPMQEVVILPRTQSLREVRLPDGTQLQTLAGNVGIRQGTTFFYCDSMVINLSTKIMEAFGRVHINDSDTAHVYANYLRYIMDTRYAYFNGNVKLTDGHGTLTTQNLEYDVATKVGTYRNGGKVVNKKSVLTSQEGVYYADVKDIYFKQN